jgi:hypothetical protein
MLALFILTVHPSFLRLTYTRVHSTSFTSLVPGGYILAKDLTNSIVTKSVRQVFYVDVIKALLILFVSDGQFVD